MLDEEDADGASTILLNVGSSGLRYFSTSAAGATVLLNFIQIQTKVAVSHELPLISLLHLTFERKNTTKNTAARYDVLFKRSDR